MAFPIELEAWKDAMFDLPKVLWETVGKCEQSPGQEGRGLWAIVG